MGGRRKSRETALQILCSLDMQAGMAPEEGILLYEKHLAPESDQDPTPAPEADPEGDDAEVQRFAAMLVKGVRGSLPELDQVLSASSRNWRLERMTWVDRNLLRLAAFELRDVKSVPARVAINEAIELAKRFGTVESPSFINGVLDRVMESLGRRS